MFESKIYNGAIFIHLPAKLTLHKGDFTNPTTHKQDICLYIRTKNRSINDGGYMLLNDNFTINMPEIIIQISKEDLNVLQNDDVLCKRAFERMQDYIYTLEKRNNKIKENLVTIDEIMKYLKEHRELALAIKECLDKSLKPLKERHPDIVASWHYYNKFEKMCQELDKD